jgi:tRNA(fMet)-specific endonuclease VapC
MGTPAAGLRIYAVDADVAWDVALLQVRSRRTGRQLATVDALSAVVDLREALNLLTTDHDFSPVTELRAENCLALAT